MDSREIGRLRQKCFSFGKTLMADKHEFSFSLKVGDFEMSLGAGGKGDRKARPRCNRKRNPAYYRGDGRVSCRRALQASRLALSLARRPGPRWRRACGW